MAPNLKVFKLFKFQIRSNFKFNRRLKFNEIHPNGGLMCSTSINPLHRTYFQYLTVVNVYSMICLPWHPTLVDMAVIRSRRRSLISPPTPPITVISWCQTRGAQQLKENSALCCWLTFCPASTSTVNLDRWCWFIANILLVYEAISQINISFDSP